MSREARNPATERDRFWRSPRHGLLKALRKLLHNRFATLQEQSS